jgi:tRNA pseudouridine13 synthase
LDYKRAFSFINKTMRMMFMHAVQSLLWNKLASYRIKNMSADVVVGDLVFVDKNAEEDENSAVKHVTQEDVDAKKYTLEDVVLPLLGTKSLRPENESGKLFDPFLEEYGLTTDVFKNIQDRDISCPGDYRKLICRPSDVDYSLVQYRDPYQPLLQTDLMKINGIPVLEEGTQEGEKGNTPLLGLVVGFTLPASAYATIALRELMKKPTSSEYQKELGLGVSATSS